MKRNALLETPKSPKFQSRSKVGCLKKVKSRFKVGQMTRFPVFWTYFEPSSENLLSNKNYGKCTNVHRFATSIAKHSKVNEQSDSFELPCKVGEP
eukprot:939908-Amphidinium_carterae.1